MLLLSHTIAFLVVYYVFDNGLQPLMLGLSVTPKTRKQSDLFKFKKKGIFISFVFYFFKGKIIEKVVVMFKHKAKTRYLARLAFYISVIIIIIIIIVLFLGYTFVAFIAVVIVELIVSNKC